MPAWLCRSAGPLSRLGLAGSLSVVAGAVLAQEAPREPEALPFFVRLGAGVVSYNTSGSGRIAQGPPITEARVAFDRHAVAIVEGGWRMAPDWSLSLLAGMPPTVTLRGEGAFAPLGELRKVTYGSVIAGVQYHPFGPGWIDPYLGAGLDYTVTLRTRAGALSELRIADSFGPVLQAGADIRLTERLSFYLDLRKIWLSFDGKGLAPTAHGLQPVRVEVQPNPVVGTVGLSYRF